MVQYWTPEALPSLRASEGGYTQVHYPSGYTPYGTKSSASGAYGFLDSTWQSYAPQAGVDISQYPRAYMAPPDVQDRVALITPVSNWTCAGCNSTAINLASNPAYVTSSPASYSTDYGGGSDQYGALGEYGVGLLPENSGVNQFGPAVSTTASGSYDPTNPETWSWYGMTNPYPPGTKYDPSTGIATSPDGTTTTTPQALGSMAPSALSQILNALGDWIGRGAVIALGLVLIVVAVWALVKDTPPGRAVKGAARAAMVLA